MAQGNPGPFGGLFGRAPVRAPGEARTVVEMRSTVGGQYDSAILAPEDAIATDTQAGLGAGASVGLSLQHQTDKFTALADAVVSRMQYFETPDFGLNLYSGNATIGSAITTRLHGDVSASYVRSPYFQVYPNFGPNTNDGVGGRAAPFAPYATQMLSNESVYASAGLTARLSERNRLSASVFRRQTLFTESGADFIVNGYSARWTWQLRRDLGVYAGYGFEHSNQFGELGQEYDNETIDVGVDYTRSFSLARRTTFSFSTSSSLVKTGTSSREIRVNGGVELSKHFRRTWRASAHATRATSFVPGFYEPLYSDMVGVSVGGMFSQRIEWGFYADAGRSEAAISNTTAFDSVSASTRLSIALNRYLSLYGQYAAYHYNAATTSNALGLPENLARQSVFVGVTAYIPIYKKMGQ